MNFEKNIKIIPTLYTDREFHLVKFHSIANILPILTSNATVVTLTDEDITFLTGCVVIN